MNGIALLEVGLQLAVGAVGGVAAFLLARRQFVSERRWERLYDLYCQVFDTLNEIESSLGTLCDSIVVGLEAQESELAWKHAEKYEDSLSKLSRYQEKLLLLGADEAFRSLVDLYPRLRRLDPHQVTHSIRGADGNSLLEVVRATKTLVHRANGDLAMVAREDLRVSLRRRRIDWSRSNDPPPRS
jgi:hypothetical protein